MTGFLNWVFSIRHSVFGIQHWTISGIVAVLLFSCLFISPAAFASDAKINCDAHQGTCSQLLGTRTVSLEISPRPVKAMQDLIFKVSISGTPPAKSPYIDLGMPAMKMGPNRVVLKPNGQGEYEGRGVIVRCQSGRRTWFGNVVIPEAGAAKFVFDVVY